MKDQHTYIDKASYANTDVRWLLSLDGQQVQIFCDGESRIYNIPEKVIDFKVEDEYSFIYVEDKYYQFKFELDKFLVGDIFTNEGEHIECFANYVFGEL